MDYKGDLREFSNRITSFINNPEFDVMDVMSIILKKLSDTANDMATYIYKRN